MSYGCAFILGSVIMVANKVPVRLSVRTLYQLLKPPEKVLKTVENWKTSLNF
jgi:hypothetical protein